jgi:hypothetical protein
MGFPRYRGGGTVAAPRSIRLGAASRMDVSRLARDRGQWDNLLRDKYRAQ